MPDVAFDRIVTARLILRRFQRDDLDNFVAYRADPDVARYQSWETFSRADGVQFIEAMSAQHPDTPGQWFQIAIELKSTREMIGDCALHSMAGASHEAEIGFTLAPRFQRHGYAVEAVAGLLDYLFGQRRKQRVLAITDVRNTPSIAVLERSGFSRDPAPREPVWFKDELCQERLYVLRRESRRR